METIFLFKLVISFFIGALWVILATIAADRLGPKIGGLISGLPSTAMFGLFFLAWTQNTSAASQATTIMPIIGGLTCLFLLIYIYLVKKGLWLALIVALGIWSILAYLLVRINFNNYPISIISYVVILVSSLLITEYVLKIKSVKGKKVSYSPSLIILRGLIGGMVVVLVVYLGKVGGPIFGGIFSMFPAMFTSTILVTYFTHGPIFSAATMKSSMLTAISIVVYSIVARYTYVPFGLIQGTFFSILISFASGYVIYKFLITKLS